MSWRKRLRGELHVGGCEENLSGLGVVLKCESPPEEKWSAPPVMVLIIAAKSFAQWDAKTSHMEWLLCTGDTWPVFFPDSLYIYIYINNSDKTGSWTGPQTNREMTSGSRRRWKQKWQTRLNKDQQTHTKTQHVNTSSQLWWLHILTFPNMVEMEKIM